MVMRTTVLLVAAVVAAIAIVMGTNAPAGPPTSMLAADPAGAPQVLPDSFDGLLYPDPDTGCIRPWREGDGDTATAEDVAGPRAVPLDPSVQVQDPEPSPELFGETHRGPWPICDELPAKVNDNIP
jgi:hypothetical protein